MNEQALVEGWKMFQREHDISIDRLICNPVLRQAFVDQVSSVCCSNDEQSILWALMSLRKNKKLAKSKKISGQ